VRHPGAPRSRRCQLADPPAELLGVGVCGHPSRITLRTWDRAGFGLGTARGKLRSLWISLTDSSVDVTALLRNRFLRLRNRFQKHGMALTARERRTGAHGVCGPDGRSGLLRTYNPYWLRYHTANVSSLIFGTPLGHD
jgi:hypothetical protein